MSTKDYLYRLILTVKHLEGYTIGESDLDWDEMRKAFNGQKNLLLEIMPKPVKIYFKEADKMIFENYSSDLDSKYADFIDQYKDYFRLPEPKQVGLNDILVYTK